MSDVHVRRGETVTLERVDGCLYVGPNGAVQAINGKTITVTNMAIFEGNATIIGDLECEALQCHSGKLEVSGSLIVHTTLDVGRSIEAKGIVKAQDIDIGGRIEATSIFCTRIRVGGKAEIRDVFEAQSVDVGGKVEALGTVRICDLNVGGEAEVGCGYIKGNIRVGGRFEAHEAIEFGDLQVSGKGELHANSKGQRISTFGKLEIHGPLECSKIEAGGYIEVEGDCRSDIIEVGGKLEVNGSLFLTEKLEGFGLTEIDGAFQAKNLRVSGKFVASKILVKETADVSGKIEAHDGIKAKTIYARVGTKYEGILVADRVEIGKSADLSWGGWGTNWAQQWGISGITKIEGDIYASEVTIGPGSYVGRIFAGNVKLELGAYAQQVTFTGELQTNFGTHIAEPPRKVTDLPKSPF